MRRSAVLTLMVLTVAAALAGCAPTAEFYNEQGLESFAARDYTRARAAFGEAVELRPDVASYQFNLGAAHQAVGDLDKAIYHYNRAVMIHPGLFKAYANMIRCYEAQGREEQVRATYERACQANPMSAIPYYHYALWHLGRGDTANAEQWFRKAVATNPNDAQANYLMGEFLINQGRRDEGLPYYHRAREIQPLHPELIEPLGGSEPVPIRATPAANEGSQ